MLLYAMSTTSNSPAMQGNSASEQGLGSKHFVPLKPIVIAVLVVAALAALWWFYVARFNESTSNAYLQADSVTLAFKVSGTVNEVLVGDNQPVKAGQALVRISDDRYQARVDELHASMDADNAAILQNEADRLKQQAELEQAQAKQQAALVQLHFSEHEYQRYIPLAASGVEAKVRLAELQRSREQAQADYQAAIAAVKSSSAQIRVFDAQNSQSKAQQASSQAAVRQAEIDLHDTTIVSPVDGITGNRTVRVGQYVQPGTRLMTVVPVQSIYLIANFKETQTGKMRVGQPATLRVDALPGIEFKGVVDSFSPGTGSQFALIPPENATGNFTKIVQRIPVKIRITTQSGREQLLPGMSVTVDVDTHNAGPEEAQR